MISVEKPGSPSEILEHHGTKGMKWGTRKAYVTKVQGQAAAYRRAGQGKGSVLDKTRTTLRTSPVTRIKARKAGVTSGEQLARQAEQHAARVSAGKSTARDMLRVYGNVSMRDIARGQKKRS